MDLSDIDLVTLIELRETVGEAHARGLSNHFNRDDDVNRAILGGMEDGRDQNWVLLEAMCQLDEALDAHDDNASMEDLFEVTSVIDKTLRAKREQLKRQSGLKTGSSISDRARWQARFKTVRTGGTNLRIVPRTKPLNVSDVTKRLRKAAIRMSARGKATGAKARQVIKRSRVMPTKKKSTGTAQKGQKKAVVQKSSAPKSSQKPLGKANGGSEVNAKPKDTKPTKAVKPKPITVKKPTKAPVKKDKDAIASPGNDTTSSPKTKPLFKPKQKAKKPTGKIVGSSKSTK